MEKTDEALPLQGGIKMQAFGLALPHLRFVRIKNFSLYSGADTIMVDFTKPVFCLAGANGLGKSTFLNCIVYGLTGVIRQPDYTFKGVQDFERDNQAFAKKYFEGRIRGRDKDLAEIEIGLKVGAVTLTVRRGFYDNEVIEWTATPKVLEVEGLDNGTLGYREAICRLLRLSDFGQFAFLIHYILTFDEHRNLLVWNPTLVTQALYLLVGWDPKEAAAADTLARQIERVDSRIRNLQYDITQARKYIQELENQLRDAEELTSSPKGGDLVARHEELHKELKRLEEELAARKEQQSYLWARVAGVSAQQVDCRKRYDVAYRLLFQSSRAHHFRQHPAVKQATDELRCGLCGAEGSTVVESVSNALEAKACPLCHSPFEADPPEPNPELLANLRALDEELLRLDKELSNLLRERDDVENAVRNLNQEYESTRLELAQLESLPVIQAASKGKGIRETVPEMVKSQLSVIQQKAQQKEKEIQERTRLKEEALRLQKRITRSYQKAEKEFLPIFRTLATKFTGLPVNLRMTQIIREHRPELRFSLELEDSQRQFDHQLSESQRFFIDIALRMAFVMYVARDNDVGFLLLDTPEGSLDIAYETNAGEMLAEFALRGQQLILTANINSSGLLLALARVCGGDRFELHRMIEWADLSAVQLSRMGLFEQALDQIEQLLGAHS